MKHPWWMLFTRTGPAGAENCPLRADDLGLNEQITEGRMKRVRGRRCENDFRITCDVDRSARTGAVSEGDPSQFDIILRRDGDHRMGVEFVVSAAELRSRLRTNRFQIF